MPIEAMATQVGDNNKIRIDSINITNYSHHIDDIALRPFDICLAQETSIPIYRLGEARVRAQDHGLR
eukprot:1215493-Karenia_brevis.AAC.1